MGVLFEYILSYSNRQKFVITEFLDLQQCHSRKSSEEEFKALINSIISSKINSKNMKNAKKFAESMIKCNFDVLKSVEFFNYWDHKEKILTRAIANNNYTTTALQNAQEMNQVISHAATITSSKPNSDSQPSSQIPKDKEDTEKNPSSNGKEDTEYNPSSQGSDDSNPVPIVVNDLYCLTNNGDYLFSVTPNSRMWVLSSGHNISKSFFDYRNASIANALDMNVLDKYGELSLSGIMVIDDEIVYARYILYEFIPEMLDDVKNIDYFARKEVNEQVKSVCCFFAEEMKVRRLDNIMLKTTLNKLAFESNSNDVRVLAPALHSLADVYCIDYHIKSVNEATFVRDTIDNFLKVYFCNSFL